jgi:peptide/nickel transport system substrate-binding protein
MTGDGLVGYNQVSGVAGTQLVPDLAVSLPAPTDGGRTYTFTLRPRIRYSDGRPVKASDFRSTIERDFKAGAPVTYYDGIIGGAACRKRPQHCDLSRGIVANDARRTITFHLTAADPQFLYELALPFAFVVPSGTAPHDVGTHPLPATGPYSIARYEPKRLIRLVRNRYFHEWSQAAQPDGNPDEIVVRVGGSTDRAIHDVTTGKADALFLTRPLSTGQLTALATRYASQLHTDPSPAVNGVFLNTRVPPFDRLDVRRAFNFAVDRTAAVQTYGGPYAARPTCQTLPPDFPGYRPYCPYTAAPSSKGTWTAPDLATARALVARSGTRGMHVTVWSWSEAAGIAPLAARTLRQLGYRVSVKPEGDNYFGLITDSRTRAQIGFWGWGADYPAPGGFFQPTFTCASFVPDSGSQNPNSSEFCDPRIDGLIARATQAQGADPGTVQKLWARVDRSLADQSPWAPLYSLNTVNLLAKRVGNYQYSPTGFGMFLDQLWVR